MISLIATLLCFFNPYLAFEKTNCWADAERLESTFSEYIVIENKIYIHPDQLYITNKGIFIFIHGEQIIVHQLNCNENGIYCLIEHLDSISGQCKNKHPIWCKRCWGCVVKWCKFRCKCVEWE